MPMTTSVFSIEFILCFNVQYLLAMQCPIVSFAWSIESTRNFNETIVERKIMSKRILPFLCIRSIIRKSISDKLNFKDQWRYSKGFIDLLCKYRSMVTSFPDSVVSPSLSKRYTNLWSMCMCEEKIFHELTGRFFFWIRRFTRSWHCMMC